MVSLLVIVFILFCLSTPAIAVQISSPLAPIEGNSASIPSVKDKSPGKLQVKFQGLIDAKSPFTSRRSSTKKLLMTDLVKMSKVKNVRKLILSALLNRDCYLFAPIQFLQYAEKNIDNNIAIVDLLPVIPARLEKPIDEARFSPYQWVPLYGPKVKVADVADAEAEEDPTIFYTGIAFSPSTAALKDECFSLRCPEHVMLSIASAMRALNKYSKPESRETYRAIFNQLLRNWQFHFDYTNRELRFFDGEEVVVLISYEKVIEDLLLPELKLEKLNSNRVRLTFEDKVLPLRCKLNTEKFKDQMELHDTLVSAINMDKVSTEDEKTMEMEINVHRSFSRETERAYDWTRNVFDICKFTSWLTGGSTLIQP